MSNEKVIMLIEAKIQPQRRAEECAKRQLGCGRHRAAAQMCEQHQDERGARSEREADRDRVKRQPRPDAGRELDIAEAETLPTPQTSVDPSQQKEQRCSAGRPRCRSLQRQPRLQRIKRVCSRHAGEQGAIGHCIGQ